MKVYNSLSEIDKFSNRILTVGTFDGVHIGHKEIFKTLLDDASASNSEHLVVTFDPHPRLVLGKHDKPKLSLLTSTEERLLLFERNNIEHVFVIKFDYDFSQLSGREFIIDYLYEKIGFNKILIGYDHTFGKNRSGNIDLLRALALEFGFEVEKIEPFKDGEIIISSTKVRTALQANEIELANELLGYTFFVSGHVIRGARRGSTIGFPTANIMVPYEFKIMPAIGVYLVSSVIDGIHYWGMANIGYRPTVSDDKQVSLEVHFFDFDGDIYDKELRINFHYFLRHEQKFNSLNDLTNQLVIDKENSIKILPNHKNDFII